MCDSRMDLFIETLTGTAFELSCSPFETIVSIKAKIQYSEGIPVSQQHLIWRSQELKDDLCLEDYSITDGATLKLVLGMRGGPINTKQVSDTKKLKNIAEYVERNSETGRSNGRPVTVLVFHDGDKVHMYTLMERGDCIVSPLSGTLSETSSRASIKNLDEVDHEIFRENEILKEKIALVQEQLRALNINKTKRSTVSVSSSKPNSFRKKSENIHLPPIERVDLETKQYSYQDTQTCIFPFIPNDLQLTESKEQCNGKSSYQQPLLVRNSHAALNLFPKNVSSFILSPDNKSSSQLQNSSSFLPYITSAQDLSSASKDILPSVPSHRNSFLEYDFSVVNKAHKKLPFSSNEAVSSQKLLDLDAWLQKRPKTTPSLRNSSERKHHTLKYSVKNLLPAGRLSRRNSSLLVQVFGSGNDITFNNLRCSVPDNNKTFDAKINEKTSIKSFATSPNTKVFKENFPDASQNIRKINYIPNPNNKISRKLNEDISKPNSGIRLPVIKSNKRSQNRCTQCSRKTGLATSYTCRCGKNFCASHRYAEMHHCTYDYKTEGRKMLQLNNPVVTASKLPKI